jgi:hypothetical protein
VGSFHILEITSKTVRGLKTFGEIGIVGGKEKKLNLP